MIEAHAGVELLGKTFLFRNLRNDDLLRQLCVAMGDASYQAGEAIVRQGEPGDLLYILVDGRARVEVGGLVVAHLEPGAYFGEMALFGSERRSATVVAERASRCLTLSHQDLSRALQQAPRIATNLMKVLCQRARRLNQMMVVARCPGRSRAVLSLDLAAERKDILRAIPIFSDISDERCLERMAAVAAECSVAAGAQIFARGDQGDRLYVLLEGQVQVHIDDLELARLGPGAHFGEISLFDAEPRFASVTAVTACRYLSLTQQQLFAVLGQSPSVALQLVRALCQQVRELSSGLADFVEAAHAEPDAASPALAPYLELPAEPIFVKDEQANRLRIPLTSTLAREFVELTGQPQGSPADAGRAEPRPPTDDADGFQRALDVERAALCEALERFERERSQAGLSERLTRLAQDLYALLRTPVFPKKSYLSLASSLYASAADDGVVHLRTVLASPTAEVEVGSFLRCADTFRRYGLQTDLRLLLVRWENLVEVSTHTPEERRATFDCQVRAVREQVRRFGFSPQAVVPVNVEADVESAAIAAPHDFQEWSSRVLRAVQDLGSADPALSRDLLWITGFYERQHSLSRLGQQQALLDLAIRRAIGSRFASEYATMPRTGTPPFAMLTSELNRRFLACYSPAVPMINIAVH